MVEEEQVIQQSTLRLPYFNEEIPVLYLANGKPYVPVIVLCNMLGLPARKHIPRWRKLVLWMHARKLLYRTANRRQQRVWCLHIGAIPCWCVCFDWSLVPPKRQEQLNQVVEAFSETLCQIHQTLVSHYQHMRRLLFEFLTHYEGIDARLSQLAAHCHPVLDNFDTCVQFEELIFQGKVLIQHTVNYARHIVEDQAINPSVDAIKVANDGRILEELSLPLFPVFLEDDCTQFLEHLRLLLQWYEQFLTFLKGQKFY